jgi:UDP-N-acetylmuramyl pentapeptide synthase
VGGTTHAIARAAIREGMGPEDVVTFDTPEGVLDDIRRSAASGDLILFKGSRVAGLETLAEALR